MYVFLFLITVLILAVLGPLVARALAAVRGVCSPLRAGLLVMGLSSCGEQAQVHRSAAATRGLNGCGAQAQLPRGDAGTLPRLGVGTRVSSIGKISSTITQVKYSCAFKVVTFPNLCCLLHLEGTGGAQLEHGLLDRRFVPRSGWVTCWHWVRPQRSSLTARQAWTSPHTHF